MKIALLSFLLFIALLWMYAVVTLAIPAWVYGDERGGELETNIVGVAFSIAMLLLSAGLFFWLISRNYSFAALIVCVISGALAWTIISSAGVALGGV